MRIAFSLVLLAVIMMTVGCASSRYMPRGPGVSMVWHQGELAYVRDGELYKHGAFGGGLSRAVAGHPLAEAAARTHRKKLTNGLVGLLGGLVGMTAGAAWLGVEAGADDPRSEYGQGSGNYLAPTALIVAGIAAYAWGISEIASAPAYQYDAINLFNHENPNLYYGETDCEAGDVTCRPAPRAESKDKSLLSPHWGPTK